MKQYKALIVDEKTKENFIIPVSKTEYDNLKLLKTYLPKNLDKEYFEENEKEAILKYNNYIDSLRQKAKCSLIQIDFTLEKIKKIFI